MELSDLTKNIPKYNVLLVGSDINAKVGQDNVKESVFNATNNWNGQLLVGYLRECNLQTLKTRYTKGTGKLWTHILPNGDKIQIDYILTNDKWKNNALNCEVYKTFCTVGSDHRCVTSKIWLSLRQSKRPSMEKKRFI